MAYFVSQPHVGEAQEALVALWEKNLRSSDRQRRYDWHYLHSPDGPGATFLLHHNGDGRSQVIGCTGMAPRSFHCEGRSVRALLSADFAVDHHHRTLMPAIMLQRAARAFARGTSDFAYGFPNASAVGVFLRVGYQRLGTLGRYVKVLDHEAYLRRAGWGIGSAWLAGRLLDVETQARDYLRSRRDRRDLHLEWLSVFDDRFDQLWEEGRSSYRIIADRNGRWLRWRFCDQWVAQPMIAVLVGRDIRSIRAYAVVSSREKGVARISDFFAASSKELSTLFRLLGGQLRRRKFRSIGVPFLGASWVHAMLTAHGYVLRERESARAVVVDLGTSLAPNVFLNLDNWYLTGADRDT